MNSDGLVSVVIPTYYRNEDLRAAIETVIRQEYEPVEIIVVDDSGDRHAESVARDYDVTYVDHEENRGANAARNTGIERSAGEYIQLLDDDRIDERKFRKQVDLLQTTEDVGVVHCGVEHDTGKSVLPDPDVRGEVLERALAFDMTPCMTSTMLMEREIVERIYPLKLRPSADDLGLMIELALTTRFDFVEEILVLKGKREDSRGGGVTNAMERLRIIDEYEHLYDDFPAQLREKDA